MPADHEAQSQVKEKAAAGVKALRGSLIQKKGGTVNFNSVGRAARVHDRERDKRDPNT